MKIFTHRTFLIIILLFITLIIHTITNTNAMSKTNIQGKIFSDINQDNIKTFYLRSNDGIPIYITDEKYINQHPEYNWIKEITDTNKEITVIGTLEENEEGEFNFKNNEIKLISEINNKKVNNNSINLKNYIMKCEKANPNIITVGKFLDDIVNNNKNKGNEVIIETKKIANNRYRFDFIIKNPMTEKTTNMSIGYNISDNIAFMSHVKIDNYMPDTQMEVMEICTRWLMPYYLKNKK